MIQSRWSGRFTRPRAARRRSRRRTYWTTTPGIVLDLWHARAADLSVRAHNLLGIDLTDYSILIRCRCGARYYGRGLRVSHRVFFRQVSDKVERLAEDGFHAGAC